ncbi:uncharacterized protein LOC131434400 [Malaya genurostris]|uniref:uncharacterized protein LOC131434400 n=1 Tax=Malaya genurostris TaxID=325434 RepID=UPI0026F3ADE8|nr:uncharacterized protein LOC131434400 [Malaya genurostris]
MNTVRLGYLVQRLEQLGTRIPVRSVPKINRCYAKNVNQFTTIACFGRPIFAKTHIIPASLTGFRYCTADCTENKFDKNCIDPSLVATYEEIADLPAHPEKLLIDVREPEELAETGVIPTSINIPLNTVSEELNLSSAAFQAKYGRKKPEANDPVIFTCRSGVRAGIAANEADRLGFKNVKNYVGSWTEYATINKLKHNRASKSTIHSHACRLVKIELLSVSYYLNYLLACSCDPVNLHDFENSGFSVQLYFSFSHLLMCASFVNWITGRFAKLSSANMSIATYEEVLDLPNHPEKLLVDVRGVEEVAETGQIPTSVNIPLPNLEQALKLSDDEFKSKFGRSKPQSDTEIIFHCKLGGRAQKAADTAIGLGYKNARNYKGSWTEWEKKQNDK